MSKSIEYDKIVKLFRAQMRSADMWIEQYNHHKDVPSVRNVSLAIGKLMGIFNVLLTMNRGDTNVDEEILADLNKYSEIWNSMGVEESN